MAEHNLNLYKIFNKKENTISDFVDHEGLNDFLMYLKSEGKSIEDYEVFSLAMPCVTKYLDLEKYGLK